MAIFSPKQVGVWLDQAKAYLIGIQDGNAFLIEIIDSNVKIDKREKVVINYNLKFALDLQASISNEILRGQIKTNELQGYFKRIQSKLEDFDDILIIGPGSIKDQFFNDLLIHHVIDSKNVQVQTKGRFSENQLLAYINDFFTP